VAYLISFFFSLPNNEYFPLINKEDYTRVHFSHLMKHYFNNSFPELAAFFARENNLSLEELQDMIKITEDELKKQI
jgi:hypothetical protein